MTDRLHVWIEGRVQGVGFRYATQAEAHRLKLNGWARNAPDGRVEAQFEGPKDALDQMLEWCRHGPRFSSVTKVTSAWDNGEPQCASFVIRG